MPKPWVIGLGSFASGVVLASGAWTAFPSRPAPPVSKEDAGGAPETDDELRKANANLTDSLHQCDRQLAELREGMKIPDRPVASAQPNEERDGGRWGAGRRNRGEPTSEDWERMAQLGVVRVRIPCIRDTPWKPSERAIDRLGISDRDAKAIEEAYAASNKRVLDQVKPLCAKALGSPDVADKMGATACIDAIQNSAKRADPKAAKDALSHAAEVQAGKRTAQAGGDSIPLEQLANVLAGESKTFEADLAKKLGPEEAKRIANDPAMCSERRVLRTSDEPIEREGAQGRRGRGGAGGD
jgi:hypothetical protein